jgi:hypothetical protein
MLAFGRYFPGRGGGFRRLCSRKHPYVLLRPPELLIVCGCALGIILIANRPSLIRKVA